MSGVVRKQASFDQELADLGRIRILSPDRSDATTTPIYRERVVDNSLDHFNRTPWWKRKKSSLRQKKS